VTDEQIEKEVDKIVSDEANLMPDPEPQMGGEGEQVEDERTVFEVITDDEGHEQLACKFANDMAKNLLGAELDTKPTPPKPTPPANMMTPDELAEYDSETVRLVSAQESAVCQLESDLASFKEEAKAAKKAVESAKEALRELIQNRDRQRGRKPTPTLFNAPAHNATATTTNRVDEGNATDQVDPHAELWREYPLTVDNWKPFGLTAELWREYPLTVDNWKPFGLTAKDVERLNSGETKNSGVHPITKFGDVTRFITPNPDSPAFTRTLKDFKGFGDAAYDRWLHAETQFWDWWNNKGGKAEFAAERANNMNAAQ